MSVFFSLVRLAVIGFAALSVIYIGLSYYFRAARRRKLIREWEEEWPTTDRDKFLRDGVAKYDGSLRRKLILGVYVIPFCVVVFIVYATNFQ